jgi:hypothetical protein
MGNEKKYDFSTFYSSGFETLRRIVYIYYCRSSDSKKKAIAQRVLPTRIESMGLTGGSSFK